MSEERKAKAAARRAARAAKKIQSSQNEPVEPITTQIDIEPLNTEIDVKSTIAKPQDIAASSLRLQDAPEIVPAKAFVQNAKGVQTLEPAADNNLSHVSTIQPQKAVSVNPTESPIQPKVVTFSDMLEGQRKKITQDKTDAAKMQRYYALTDALKALGQMGGAAIGGAIGGNVLDSAPKVAEYKESRGYLDAIENAKRANDRLRALDEKEFQLAYNKQQKAEERAYQERIRREKRAYQEKMTKLEREWREALADKNAKRQAEIKKEILTIQNAHEKEMKQYSLEIARIQNGGRRGKEVPFRFTNGIGISIPKEYYDDMLDSVVGMEWNGETVDKETAQSYLRNHPEYADDYLRSFGLGFMDRKPVEQVEEHVEETPKKSFWKRLAEASLREDMTGGIADKVTMRNGDVNIFDYERTK